MSFAGSFAVHWQEANAGTRTEFPYCSVLTERQSIPFHTEETAFIFRFANNGSRSTQKGTFKTTCMYSSLCVCIGNERRVGAYMSVYTGGYICVYNMVPADLLVCVCDLTSVMAPQGTWESLSTVGPALPGLGMHTTVG